MKARTAVLLCFALQTGCTMLKNGPAIAERTDVIKNISSITKEGDTYSLTFLENGEKLTLNVSISSADGCAEQILTDVPQGEPCFASVSWLKSENSPKSRFSAVVIHVHEPGEIKKFPLVVADSMPH